jgi:hypothetical protein
MAKVEAMIENDPQVVVCQGPPVCDLQGDEAEAAMKEGCPWCKVIVLHEDGTETVREPCRA